MSLSFKYSLYSASNSRSLTFVRCSLRTRHSVSDGVSPSTLKFSTSLGILESCAVSAEACSSSLSCGPRTWIVKDVVSLGISVITALSGDRLWNNRLSLRDLCLIDNDDRRGYLDFTSEICRNGRFHRGRRPRSTGAARRVNISPPLKGVQSISVARDAKWFGLLGFLRVCDESLCGWLGALNPCRRVDIESKNPLCHPNNGQNSFPMTSYTVIVIDSGIPIYGYCSMSFLV